MCWFIDLTVVPRKAAISERITKPKLPGPESLRGRNLSFSYGNHHCACKVVEKKRFAGLVAAVNAFCEQAAVKRVEVRQFWADQESTPPRPLQLSPAQFADVCSTTGLEENVCYRVSPERLDRPGES